MILDLIILKYYEHKQVDCQHMGNSTFTPAIIIQTEISSDQDLCQG